MSEPAMANDDKSIPMSVKMFSPTNKKIIMMSSATADDFSAWMLPTFLRIAIIAGMLPTISMTEKRIIDTVKISLKLKFILGVGIK